MNQDVFRYRVITNLQCNNRCSFCYQTYKPCKGCDVILDKGAMEATMLKVHDNRGKLKRATIMGGETMLTDKPHEYVSIAKKYVDTVCLVTNGTLLDTPSLALLRDAGLDEIAISIHSMANFNQLDRILELANMWIPNMRVNVPRCEESSGSKLRDIVYRCIDSGYGCVVCEDLMGRYGDPHHDVMSGWDDFKEVSNEYNFVTYEHTSGKKIGLFAHYSGYNSTDIIITPLGNFHSWKKYCNKVDNYALR